MNNTKQDKLREEFYKKFKVEQYDEKLGFISSGMTISSAKMWDWIQKTLYQREREAYEKGLRKGFDEGRNYEKYT
jgi:hypothetical protein